MEKEKLTYKLTESKEMPFRVPEGYFESFTDRMMAQLPKTPQSRPILRLWRYAVAVVIVATITGSAYYFTQSNITNDTNANSYELYSSNYDDQLLDYTLMNNNDIETFLTEAY